jgi:hypothetical protein
MSVKGSALLKLNGLAARRVPWSTMMKETSSPTSSTESVGV